MIKQKNLLVLKFGEVDYHNFHINEFKKIFNSVDIINYDYLFLKRGISGTENTIIKSIETNNTDIVFIFLYVNNFELSLEFLRDLKKKVYLVFWFFDDEVFFHSYNKFYGQLADVVITTSYYDRFAYEQLGIPAILYFSSYSKKDYYPLKIKRDIDVSFVGLTQCRPERMEYIDFLKENGISVQCFGSDFDSGFLSIEEMNRTFSRSKINLNFTGIAQIEGLDKDNPFLPVIKQNKGRPIEIALTKSFCLSESAPSVDKVFKINREIAVFSTKKELLEKVIYYLQNDDLRQRIADNAYSRASKMYESDIYIKNVMHDLFSLIKSSRNERNKDFKIYINPQFERRIFLFLRSSIIARIKNKDIKQFFSLIIDIKQKYGLLFCVKLLAGIIFKKKD